VARGQGQGRAPRRDCKMDLQLIVEKGLFDLLHRIAADYELDYDELCERYMSAPAPKVARVRAVRAVRTGSPPPTCRGRTAKGLACKKKASEGCDGYCKTHAPKDDGSGDEVDVPVTCRAITAKGLPCKKKASEGCNGYCKTHGKEELESESEDESVVLCKGMTGKKQPCKKKASEGCNGYCKTHKDSVPFKLNPVHDHAPEDVSEDCEACSVYGDPVNSPAAKREFTIVRRSERLKEQAKAWSDVEEDEDETQDMESYAAALAAEMREQGILDDE
jgi:hypothetical protein